MIVWIDGRFVEESAAVVSIADRGLLLGDAVFETALLHSGGFLRLRQHLDRFAASAALLRLAHPPPDDIEGVVRRLARENALDDGNLRITLTRGVTTPTLFITLRPPDARWIDRARRGWSIVTARTRRPSTAAIPAQLKAVGRTYALLAKHEAADAAADDALLLTDEGVVCEGPSWNVFWRRGSTLFTPAIDAGVLVGVTRTILLAVAADAGFDVAQGLFPRQVLDDADEIFATMTSVGIVSIRSLDGRSMAAETPAADALLPRYWQVVDTECAADRIRFPV
jgi:branched-chain amino acid aminotransferase